MKKILALVLALMLVAGMVSAFADDPVDPFATTSTVNVKVTGLLEGDTLHLYKLATPTKNASNEMELAWINDDIYTAVKDLATESGYSPTAAMQAAIAKLVTDGKIDVSGDGSPKGTVAAGATDVTVAAAPGYYLALVKNGAKSLEAKVIYQNMIINVLPVPDTAGSGAYVSHAAVEVAVKSSTETLTKTQKEKNGTDYAATTVEGYKIGDYIPFKIETRIPSYPTNSKVAVFEIHDDPVSGGLKIKQDTEHPVVVKIAGEAVTPTANDFTVTVANGKLDIVFTKAYILAHPNADVEVTYDAQLYDNGSNVQVNETQNNAKIKYNNNPDEESYNEPGTTIKQKTFNFTVLKHKQGDETVTLAGAKFWLYDAATDGNKIEVVKVADGVYRPFKPGEDAEADKAEYIEVIGSGENKGQATVQGLAKTTYWLEEKVAPAGFKKLTSRVECAATEATSDNSTTTIDYKIPNTEGQSLPETGGMGTTLLYVGGSILVLLAVILLVTKKRMSAND